MSTEKVQAAKGLLEELKGGGGATGRLAPAAAMSGAGPAASASDMPALIGALERLVEAYIELAMVGYFVVYYPHPSGAAVCPLELHYALVLCRTNFTR